MSNPGEADGPDGSSAAYGRRCVLGAAVLWSVSGAFTKRINLDPSVIAFYRGLFAGLALLPFVPRGRRVVRAAMVPTALAFGAMTGLYIGAIKATTAANAIVLQYTATFWMIPIAALFLRERPDRRTLAGVALAIAGIATIVLDSHRGPSEGRGIALGLGSGVAYAAVVVGLRGLRTLDPVWLSAANNLGGAMVLGAWIAATTGAVPVPGLAPALALVAFGIIQMAIPYILFARGLREITAPEAGLIALLEPILNPIWTYLAAGERPAPATIVGGVLLLSGVTCRYLPRHRFSKIGGEDRS